MALRRLVFICGETLAIVPCTIVPVLSSMVTVSFEHFIKNLTSFMLADAQLWSRFRYREKRCLEVQAGWLLGRLWYVGELGRGRADVGRLVSCRACFPKTFKFRDVEREPPELYSASRT